MLNNKKRAKVIAGLLALSMILSMTPGCGNNTYKNDPQQNQTDKKDKDEEETQQSHVHPYPWWMFWRSNSGNETSNIINNSSSSKSNSTVSKPATTKAPSTGSSGQTGIGSSSSRSSAVS